MNRETPKTADRAPRVARVAPGSQVLLGLMVLAAACAQPTYRYEHPTKPDSAYENDWNICTAINEASISTLGLIMRPFRAPPIDRCLRTLGWKRASRVKVADQGPAVILYTSACTPLRFGPDESRGTKARLDPGQRLVETGRRAKWVRVDTGEMEGWVAAKDVGPDDPQLPPCPPLEGAQAP
jgi:hypothetical protein